MAGSEDDTLPIGPGGLPARSNKPTKVAGSLLGQTVDGFFVKGFLGGGGMGDVYLAEQNLGAGTKLVALKTIRNEHQSDSVAIQRFQEEALAAGTMKTNYVAEVMSYGQLAATPSHPAMHYLVMEYASAGTLHDYMMKFPDLRLPIEEGIRLLRQAAEGMLAAERRVDGAGNADPIVHRDIKPANLLLQRSGATDEVEIRISDFGAVKRQKRIESGSDPMLSQAGAPMTPVYASPEQWNFEETDHRSDMYSLGATFYHALTGRRAAPETDVMSDIRKFAVESPSLSLNRVLKDVPEELNAVIETMTARKAADRYPSFADLIEALKVFERQPVSLKKVWWSIVLIAAALTVAIFLTPSSGGVTAKTLISEYKQLNTTIENLRSQAALATLPEFDERLSAIQQQASRELQALNKSSSADGDMVPRDKSNDRVKLGVQLQNCAKQFEAAKAALTELEAIRAAYEEVPCDVSRQAVAAVRHPQSKSIDDKKRELRALITARLTNARQRVSALEETLLRNTTPNVVEASTKPAASLRTLQEDVARAMPLGLIAPEIKTQLANLSSAVAGAIQLEEQLPTWQANMAKPDESLRAFVAALNAVADVPAQTNVYLIQWWPNRREQHAATWANPALELIRVAKAAYEESVVKARALPTAQAKREFDTNIILAWDTLDALLKQVRQASRKVFRLNPNDAIEKEAEFGAKPILDYSVEELTTGYAGVLTVAESFQACERQLTTGDTTKVVAELIDTCESAIASLKRAKSPRIPTMGDMKLPEQLKTRLIDKMETAIVRWGTDLESNNLNLTQAQTTLSTLMNVLAKWHDTSQKRATAIYNDVRIAADIVRAYEKAVPRPGNSGNATQLSLSEAVDRLGLAVAKLKEIQDAPPSNERIRRWRDSWVRAQLSGFVKPVKEALRDVRENGKAFEDLRNLDKHLKVLWPDMADELREDLRLTLKALANKDAPVKPGNWTEQAWKLWPADRIVPKGLRAEVRAGQLICWFEFRNKVVDGGAEKRVEMILIDRNNVAPFLVDRHEVCVGEMRALGLSRNNDPSGYYFRRSGHWRDINKTPTALLSWTSHEMATRFALSAYSSNTKFSLPSVSQWQTLLPSDAKPETRPETNDPTIVRIDTADNLGGVFGLRTGLAEWLSNESFAGKSDYDRDSLNAGVDWIEGVGFRCVLNLK